ncbi:uncharacterized protein METZ01_LOCUS333120, partial [marine metagenome]
CHDARRAVPRAASRRTPWPRRRHRREAHRAGAQRDFSCNEKITRAHRAREHRRAGHLHRPPHPPPRRYFRARQAAGAARCLPRHGTLLRRRLRHPHAQGLGRRDRRGRPNDRTGTGTGVSPQRLEDGSQFASRSSRPHWPRVDRQKGVRPHRQRPEIRRHARLPRDAQVPRPARGHSKPGHPSVAAEKGQTPAENRV